MILPSAKSLMACQVLHFVTVCSAPGTSLLDVVARPIAMNCVDTDSKIVSCAPRRAEHAIAAQCRLKDVSTMTESSLIANCLLQSCYLLLYVATVTPVISNYPYKSIVHSVGLNDNWLTRLLTAQPSWSSQHR